MPKYLPWQLRYIEAHRRHQQINTPEAVKDHGFLNTKIPDVESANGLTLFIINFLNWSGHRATRINVAGRLLDKITTTQSGAKFRDKKYIKSSTRKGTADISATISGRSAMLEIKTGSDQPRPEQLKEQSRERAAGGIYEFICDVEQFFVLYDSLMRRF